ncbi:hypothetical protein AGMMS49925_08250 [Deltaproteobacteria bacterium]|nr:hypothetical protein AGMMS49925_08250 [Deltaproteobacteria bacterium]
MLICAVGCTKYADVCYAVVALYYRETIEFLRVLTAYQQDADGGLQANLGNLRWLGGMAMERALAQAVALTMM